MRIPLDYYKILGVTVEARDEELREAYDDRIEQRPRREYSELVMTARKQLLSEAFEILSDLERRNRYNTSSLGTTDQLTSTNSEEVSQPPSNKQKSNHPIPSNPSITIRVEQFPGAMLILQELGEYEKILKLAPPYLTDLKNKKIALPDIVKEQQLIDDVVQAMALACLELGWEKWQQQEYENAATYLQMGLDLLLQEGKFITIQEEITADLYKLRPYRILELLAKSKIEERNLGLQLLKEMLAQRQGIEGKGEDNSGLTIDDFLRFIQQIRSYLTVVEQQELFEAEAKRPSAVATYLAIYALIARGFIEQQPALIVRGKEMLKQLGKSQDVYLEQSVCCLLLGQTAESMRLLEKSQEHETLKFIRENSQGSPDLLPGLCLYTEAWLSSEVFKHFRDLGQKQASLKEYFAEPQVQIYLEQLARKTTPELNYEPKNQIIKNNTDDKKSSKFFFQNQPHQQSKAPSTNQPHKQYANYQLSQQNVMVENQGNTATLTAPAGSFSLIKTQEKTKKSPENELVEIKSYRKNPHQESRPRQRKSRQGLLTKKITKTEEKVKQSKHSNVRKRRGKTPKKYLQIKRILLLGVMGIILLLLLRGIINLFKREESLVISLNQPPIAILEIENQANVLDNERTYLLDKEKAMVIIKTWLDAKSQALGSEGKIEALNTILTTPIISRWQSLAQSLQASNSFWQYEYPLIEIRDVQIAPENPLKATVKAQVREVGEYYQNGRLNQTNSYDSNLVVAYQLVYNKRWLIENVSVVEKL